MPSAWSRRGSATRKFFWESDQKTPLESRLDRLHTLLFHKKLGSYRDKAERISMLAEWIARDVLGSAQDAEHAATAGRLAKTDLTTDMVFEFTELQGTIGGIYARQEGLPEQVWKAIYYHYLPDWRRGGCAAVAAAARGGGGRRGRPFRWPTSSTRFVSLSKAGERATGSRDPFGLRRQTQGAVRILMDLPAADRDRSGGLARAAARARRRAHGHDNRRVDGRGAEAALALRARARPLCARAARIRGRGRACGHAGRRRQSAARAPDRRSDPGHARVGRLPGAGRAVQAGQEHRPRAVARPRRSIATALTEPAERALLEALDAPAPAIRDAAAAERLPRAPSLTSPAFARPSTGSLPRCSSWQTTCGSETRG